MTRRYGGTMDLQVSEIVDLGLAVAVLPLFVTIMKRTRDPGGRMWLTIGYALVLAANTFTILEGVGGSVGEWLNLAEHVSLALAGAAFLLSLVATRDAMQRRHAA